MKISYYTLGCKLNQAETEELKTSLEQAGFLSVPYDSGEDIAIIRACGVTRGASQSSREMVRRAARQGIFVVAIGCLENKKLKEINFFAKDNRAAYQYITKNFIPKKTASKRAPRKTRALIKIQSGCNFNCAYCLIPRFRGPSQSIAPHKIITQIKEAESRGYQEVVLTGINICQYHAANLGLSGLLKKILKDTKIKRIRPGSLDPRLVTNGLINLFLQETRLLPHWHLSLQSGSDSVLRAMRRGYTTKNYLALIKKIRQKNPLFSFTTDIIVGFPGETEKNFKKTLNFIKQAAFTKIHVFPYSPRPGTAAAGLAEQIPEKTKFIRARTLRQAAVIEGKKFKAKFIGLTRPVLFEQKKNGVWSGYTPEYILVKQSNKQNLNNKIKEVKIKEGNIFYF